MSRSNRSLAPIPPMGWNSFDCYSGQITEEEFRANVNYLAEHLKPFGYEYAVIDTEWYAPSFKPGTYYIAEPYEMDGFGRMIPPAKRWPSAGDGKGFKPLADYMHGLGLRFGIHIVRGIPKEAVHADLPILGTDYRASQIADKNSLCPWADIMYGVDPTKPGAQEYYDSLLELYASWHVDFIKADDISNPYHKGEIELLRRAIDRCGRQMVLSLSPGEAPLEEAEHMKEHSEMWRISNDIWDRWDCIERGFELCEKWQGHAEEGCWPDADMLPFGRIELRPAGQVLGERWTRLTKDEQITFMTLWCMFRSPLMIGSNLPDLDPWTLSLLTNDEVLEIVRSSRGNRQLFRRDGQAAWTAEARAGSIYLAIFNTTTEPSTMSVDMSELGLKGAYSLRDLWMKQDLGKVEGSVSAEVPGHGARLFRLAV